MKNYRSYSEIKADLNAKKVDCQSLVNDYLQKIEANKHLNAFLDVYNADAIQNAELIDQKIKDGTSGKLAGMVLGIKDVICQKGKKIRAGSKILGDYVSPFSSTVVERLIQEDAIIIGSLNCDEFAMGSSNENSAFGPVRNPLNVETVPGGSSGGSAAAVAAGLCLASLGSDTGGSIRQPASFCGITGLKTTYGRVSRWGLIAYASSFDQIGPFTHNPADASLILEVMGGQDEKDNTSSSVKNATFEDFENAKVDNLTIGVIKESIEMDGLDTEIKAHFDEVIKKLIDAGHQVEYISFPYLEYLIPTYYILTTAEASSNLARFDGVKYGFRDENAKTLEELYTLSRSNGFGCEVKRRIMLGTFVLSAGYFDAYYVKAQKIRRLLQNETQKLLSKYDFIISPTTPTTAFKIGEKANDPISMYLSDIYTVHANLTGHPALSVPVGTHSNGMPFGVQALASFFDEARLLKFGEILTK